MVHQNGDNKGQARDGASNECWLNRAFKQYFIVVKTNQGVTSSGDSVGGGYVSTFRGGDVPILMGTFFDTTELWASFPEILRNYGYNSILVETVQVYSNYRLKPLHAGYPPT